MMRELRSTLALPVPADRYVLLFRSRGMASHHALELLPVLRVTSCTLPSWTVKELETTVKITLMFSSPSTGWDWKEGWKRKEKRAWTQLPASGQPSQSHACSAQSSHYDRELPIPAFQTSKCHLPGLCAWQSVPSAGPRSSVCTWECNPQLVHHHNVFEVCNFTVVVFAF